MKKRILPFSFFILSISFFLVIVFYKNFSCTKLKNEMNNKIKFGKTQKTIHNEPTSIKIPLRYKSICAYTIFIH